MSKAVATARATPPSRTAPRLQLVTPIRQPDKRLIELTESLAELARAGELTAFFFAGQLIGQAPRIGMAGRYRHDNLALLGVLQAAQHQIVPLASDSLE